MTNYKCKFCLKIHGEEKCKKEDLQEALEFYEDSRFILNMKDGWTCKDFETDSFYYNTIQEIKKRIGKQPIQ